MKSTKDIIQEMVMKSVRETLRENAVRNRVRQIVAEELKKELVKEDDEGDSKTDNKRETVMKALKDPKYDHAQIAYALYHPKDESEKDTVRSLFSKKATGNPDADGAIRHFDDDEINKVYQLIRKK